MTAIRRVPRQQKNIPAPPAMASPKGMAIEPPQRGVLAQRQAELEASPQAGKQRELAVALNGSPTMTAQRRRIEAINGSQVVQRAIKGRKEYPEGWLDIDFNQTKNDAQVGEEGEVSFIPKFFGRPLEKIYLEQSVRNIRHDRDQEITTPMDSALRAMVVNEGLGEGMYADNVPRGLKIKAAKRQQLFEKRLKERTLHYYINAGAEDEVDQSEPRSKKENQVGKRQDNKIEPARLHDTPQHSEPMSFEFITSATAEPGSQRLGHVHWGFEVVAKNAKENEVSQEFATFAVSADNPTVNEIQDQTKELFYKALENKKAETLPDEEDVSSDVFFERKVYDIFRMTDLQKSEFYKNCPSVEAFAKRVEEGGIDLTTRKWKTLYEMLIGIFPEGRSF